MAGVSFLEVGKKYMIQEKYAGLWVRPAKPKLFILDQIVKGSSGSGVVHYIFKNAKTGCVNAYANWQLPNIEIREEKEEKTCPESERACFSGATKI